MNWILGAICAASVFHALLAAWCARVWRNEERTEAEGPALTLLRPIKAGVPALREKLAALAQAMRAGDQLVLGVNEGSPEAGVADAVREEFAEREIAVVRCGAGAALNPKISKLMQMETAVRGEHLVLSDCEAQIDAAWLEAFRREWAGSGAEVLTCGHRFVEGGSWRQALDAAPVLFSLWPGLFFVRRFGRMNFTLGACTGLRRSDVARVGGWAAFGDDLAEDNRLGAALAKAGRTIRLSRQVVTLEHDALTWREYWRHQRRLAVTYRVGNPAGFAGKIFTHSVVAGTLLAVAHPGWLEVCVALQLVRALSFRAVAKAVRFPLAEFFEAMLVSDLVETVCWALAWLSPAVWWSGERRRISREGKLRANQNVEEE